MSNKNKHTEFTLKGPVIPSIYKGEELLPKYYMELNVFTECYSLKESDVISLHVKACNTEHEEGEEPSIYLNLSKLQARELCAKLFNLLTSEI